MKFAGQKPIITLAKLMRGKIKPIKLEMTPEALAERNALLAKSAAIVKPNNASENQLVGNSVVALRERVKAVKASRKEITKPLDDAIAQAIAIEKEYCGALETEIERLKKVGDAWQDEEDERVKREEKARAAEVNRLAELKRAEETKLEEATGKKAEKIECNIAQIEQQFQVVVRQDLPTAMKAVGQSRVNKLCWEITDAKLAYEKNPHFFNPPQPRASVINQCAIPDAERDEANPETTLYPGIKCWWTKMTNYR